MEEQLVENCEVRGILEWWDLQKWEDLECKNNLVKKSMSGMRSPAMGSFLKCYPNSTKLRYKSGLQLVVRSRGTKKWEDF